MIDNPSKSIGKNFIKVEIISNKFYFYAIIYPIYIQEYIRKNDSISSIEYILYIKFKMNSKLAPDISAYQNQKVK